jgi:hypothetical protein
MDLGGVFLTLFVIYCPFAGLALGSHKSVPSTWLLNVVLCSGVVLVAGVVFSNFGLNSTSILATVFIGVVMTANRFILAKRMVK